MTGGRWSLSAAILTSTLIYSPNLIAFEIKGVD